MLRKSLSFALWIGVIVSFQRNVFAKPVSSYISTVSEQYLSILNMNLICSFSNIVQIVA